MLLKRQDAEIFYDLYFKVIKNFFYSSDYKGGKQEFENLSLEEISLLRDKLFSNISFLNKYCSLNPDGLGDEELDIIKKWKFFVKKTFIVYKDLKKYTIFVDTQESIAYGVLGLTAEIKDLLGNKFPVMADALLLSFKDSIIFDGLISPYEMKISGALKMILINSYKDSKSKIGIVTSLPPKGKSKKQNEMKMLEYYLERNKNGDSYSDEIARLLQNNFSLLKQYYDGIIKPTKEIYSVIFKSLGLKKGWFAVLDGLIITSGHTKDEVLQKLNEFLPPDKVEKASIFEIS